MKILDVTSLTVEGIKVTVDQRGRPWYIKPSDSISKTISMLDTSVETNIVFVFKNDTSEEVNAEDIAIGTDGSLWYSDYKRPPKLLIDCTQEKFSM